MTDAELIVASRDDPVRFRELYDRLADDLLAYFYRRVRDAEVAADLLAETFAVAFERRHRFRDRGKPGAAWLYGIALHGGLGMLLLLVAAALSVYKPRGMTAYGWRRQHEQRTASAAADAASPASSLT